MASAIIKIKDTEDGKAIDMDVELSPEVDNDSLAHRLVQSWIEFINAPSPEAQDTEGRPTEAV